MRKMLVVLAVAFMFAGTSCVIVEGRGGNPHGAPPGQMKPKKKPHPHGGPPGQQRKAAPQSAAPAPAHPVVVQPPPVIIQPAGNNKCEVMVKVGNKTFSCKPGPAACQGAINQCRKQYANAKSFDCDDSCK